MAIAVDWSKYVMSAVLVGSLFSTDAWGQSPSAGGGAEDNVAAALKLSDEGLALFKARDYRHASEKFSDAYALDPDPNLLFNLARCYEALGDTTAAIEKYEQFIDKPGADSNAKLRAGESLKTLRQLQAKAGSAANTERSGPSGPAAGSGDARDTKPASGGSLARYGWVGLGLAAVGGGVGTVFYMLGSSDHSKVTDAPNYGQTGKVVGISQREAESLVDSGDVKKTVGITCWAVGGAALVAAVILFSLPAPKEKRASLDVRGTASPGGGWMTVQGRF